jgi:hypothetical protein
MKHLMDRIYSEVHSGGLAYLKLQSPGISSHAWLITEMEQTDGGGYRYKFIDSNFINNPLPWHYKYGDTKIYIYEDMGIPYLQRSLELNNIRNAIHYYITN